MQTLAELARSALCSLLHPRAADYVDPQAPDAGMTMALTIDTLQRGEPAVGRVELGGVRDVRTEGMTFGFDDSSRLQPPSKLTKSEQDQWCTGAVRKVNCTWTEWSSPRCAAGDWQLHLRIESPVIQEFWLELVLDARHRRWLHRQLCGVDSVSSDDGESNCPQLVIQGRMSNFGYAGGLVGFLRAATPDFVQLHVDDRHRPSVWFEMTIHDPERLNQISAEPVAHRTRALERSIRADSVASKSNICSSAML